MLSIKNLVKIYKIGKIKKTTNLDYKHLKLVKY